MVTLSKLSEKSPTSAFHEIILFQRLIHFGYKISCNIYKYIDSFEIFNTVRHQSSKRTVDMNKYVLADSKKFPSVRN